MPNPLQKPAFRAREDGMSTDVMDKAKAEMLSEEQTQAVRRVISEPLMVLTGGPGIGKCVTGNTLVVGSDGLISIREHWQRARGEVIVTDRGWSTTKMPPPAPDTFLDYAANVVARTGIAQTSHVYYGGVRETIRARTALGLEIEGTPNHCVWMEVKAASGEWRRLDELSVGMSIAVRVGDNVWRDLSIPIDMDRMIGERTAYLFRDEEPSLTGFFFRCQRESVIGFLSGFFGIVAYNQRENAIIRGKSPLFLRDLQLLLLNFGIVSRYARHSDEATLSLDKEEWSRFQAEFTNESRGGARTRSTDIWDAIVSIEPSSAEVFDLSVPGEESFIGNGFINHNLHQK